MLKKKKDSLIFWLYKVNKNVFFCYLIVKISRSVYQVHAPYWFTRFMLFEVPWVIRNQIDPWCHVPVLCLFKPLHYSWGVHHFLLWLKVGEPVCFYKMTLPSTINDGIQLIWSDRSLIKVNDRANSIVSFWIGGCAGGVINNSSELRNQKAV